jgi:hypothetical protein
MSTLDQFEALLERRAALRSEHESACDILAEEPSATAEARCLRLHGELEAIEEQIAAEIATEQAAGEQG